MYEPFLLLLSEHFFSISMTRANVDICVRGYVMTSSAGFDISNPSKVSLTSYTHSHPSLFIPRLFPLQVFLQRVTKLHVDSEAMYRTPMLLTPVCLPLANTRTIVFGLGAECLGHFTPLRHIYSSLSMKWKDTFFLTLLNFPLNGQMSKRSLAAE